MGMKYRERCYNLQKRKKKLIKTVEDLHDTLTTACRKYSILESTMELIMASASQIQKIQYGIVSPGSKNICINSTPLLGKSLQVSQAQFKFHPSF